ncbi:hypothetical protein TELCIR_18928 [Teladorsagia circumcincta]|uniref:Uncharacterized protein n=1 Tax=Teladorsagia circumcincta TaxID=45464 RepID=A0A2G9TNP5_TELCI|nr:hypothetical protein TELCIR_18928 [Teladorsagia circumcincta]
MVAGKMSWMNQHTIYYVMCTANLPDASERGAVWVLSVIISVPPLIGWNDWSSQKLRDHCELSSER